MNIHVEEASPSTGDQFRADSSGTDRNRYQSPPVFALEIFEPALAGTYAIDEVAHLAGMPRRMILVCWKQGLIAGFVDPVDGGYRFGSEAIRTLRRVEALREVCGFNVVGLKLMFELTREVERLRERVRHHAP